MEKSLALTMEFYLTLRVVTLTKETTFAKNGQKMLHSCFKTLIENGFQLSRI